MYCQFVSAKISIDFRELWMANTTFSDKKPALGYKPPPSSLKYMCSSIYYDALGPN